MTSAAPDASTPAAADIKALLQANGTGDIGNQVGPVTAQQIILRFTEQIRIFLQVLTLSLQMLL
jgi:hypothetical protein